MLRTFLPIIVIAGLVLYGLTWMLSKPMKFKMFFVMPEGQILTLDERKELASEWRISMIIWTILYFLLLISGCWLLSAIQYL